MAVTTPRHLFVYGTLMTAAGGALLGGVERRMLHGGSRSLGPAMMAVRLFDAGRYPVLVDARAPSDVVHGEVLELEYPPTMFAILDPYEGFDTTRPNAGLYRREVRPVRLADDTGLDAWVYVYLGPLTGSRHIADGRWTA